MEQDPSPDAPVPSADVEALRGTPVSELTQLTPAASGALERLRTALERAAELQGVTPAAG